MLSSLVKITEFRLERKSCKGFFRNKFSTNLMRAIEFITGHVIYNPAYTYKYQLKTTIIMSTLVHPTLHNTKCNAFSQQLPCGPSMMYRPGGSKEKPATGLGLYIIDGPYGM